MNHVYVMLKSYVHVAAYNYSECYTITMIAYKLFMSVQKYFISHLFIYLIYNV